MRSIAIAFAIAAACHERTVDPRTRVLDLLPSDADTVVVAAGAAIPPSVVEAVRPFVPAELACVLDDIPAADAIAVSIGDGIVIALAARELARPCAVLSRYEPELWVATLGGGQPADAAAVRVLDAPAWSRARSYLQAAPIAIARAGLIATARTEPIELWIAADTPLPEPVVAAWREAHLDVARHGTQLVARDVAGAAPDLAALVRATLRELIAPALAPPITTFALACRASPLIVRCGPHELVVRSVVAAVHALADAGSDDAAGVRLRTAVLGLAAGDLVLAVDARRITSVDTLARSVAVGTRALALAVRRGELDLAVDVRQQE